MNGQIAWDHFKELQSEFPNLVLTFENNRYFIRGDIQFRAQFLSDELIEESFLIEIELSDNYPAVPPIARELGGRVPNTFHTFSDGTLCLGAPLAVKMTFSKDPTMLGFVKTQLIPYFYSFSFQEDNNKRMPYGELGHGARGILTYYLELFQVTSVDVVLKFLYLLAFKEIRGHQTCPCGSGSITRICHGSFLLELQNFHTIKEFEYEFRYCNEIVKQKRGPK
jgi:hypothetical protein